MLSYQHIYHAGCLADVHKHMALSAVLEQMAKKDKPFYYMETHAGRGLYNLNSQESLKTGEAESGILSLRSRLPAGHAYTKLLDDMGTGFYPGSPMVAHKLLRRDDRMFLMELHPQEFAGLKQNMGQFSNVFLHNRDGYKQVLALSPPLVRRGIVLVDPSYELKEEYTQAAEFIGKLHKKWPEAVVVIWYPVLKAGYHKEMMETLNAMALPKAWHQEVLFKRPKETAMLGSGLFICNMPYGAEIEAEKAKQLFL